MRLRAFALLAMLGAALLASGPSGAAAPPARAPDAAVVLGAGRAYAAFPSLRLDGGAARNLDRGRADFMGGVVGGLGLYDGDRVWDFTAGVRGVRGDQRVAIVSGARTSIESGLGLHVSALWDLDRRTPGAGVAVSLSLLSLGGDVVFDGTPTTHVSIYLSIPAGFLAYLALGGRR